MHMPVMVQIFCLNGLPSGDFSPCLPACMLLQAGVCVSVLACMREEDKGGRKEREEEEKRKKRQGISGTQAWPGRKSGEASSAAISPSLSILMNQDRKAVTWPRLRGEEKHSPTEKEEPLCGEAAASGKEVRGKSRPRLSLQNTCFPSAWKHGLEIC